MWKHEFVTNGETTESCDVFGGKIYKVTTYAGAVALCFVPFATGGYVMSPSLQPLQPMPVTCEVSK
jgi:hypothetical protein